MAIQLVTLAAGAALLQGHITAAQATAVFTWVTTGLGLGLVAAFVHSNSPGTPDALTPYREARALLLDLLDISGGLSSGLDPVTLGGTLVTAVADEVPASSLTLHVPAADGLTPLVRSGTPAHGGSVHEVALANAAVAQRCPQIEGREFAVPLVADDAVVAVATGQLSDQFALDHSLLADSLDRLSRQLTGPAVRLDAALLFGRFRDNATADERRRLAREMHDGVAQDIVYLGYLVDAVAADPASPEQAEQLQLLRDRITGVVAEVRRSVLTLRSSADGSESLGAAISTLARHLSDVSGVPIRVTVHEGTTRLRPEVEAELLRIAQEAMNNAVRHAQASRIDVQCLVEPPAAEITVLDDGRGLQGARVDSHGRQIMRERARLIGAELTVGNREEGGVQVCVRIPDGASPATRPTDGEATPAATNDKTMAVIS
ncbi:MAG: sensor histidine kinase [Nocardioides sp.]